MANLFAAAKAAIKTVGRCAAKYAPDVLTGIGVVAFGYAVVKAAKDTPKAMKLREQAEEKKGEPLTKMEKVVASAPAYIPTVGAAVTGVACIAGGHYILHKRLGAMAFSLAASEKALSEFTEKAREIVGDKKTDQIKDAVAEKHLLDNPVSKNEVIITGNGDHLIYDSYSGRYFKGDIEKVRQAVNSFNEALLTEMTKSLAEFYDILGIPTNEIDNQVGWDVGKGLLEVHFSSHLTDTGEPCLSIEYWNEPTSDYMYHSY